MKTSDISDTPLVRKYGVRGAKLYVRLWFPFMYVLLIALTSALWAVVPEFAVGWKRIFLGCLVCGLTVLAASLLTGCDWRFCRPLSYWKPAEGLQAAAHGE